MLREIGAQAPLAPFTAAEIAPGPACRSDAEIDGYIRGTAVTVHHPMGTCKMGSAADDMAVVDDELRVFGAEGLRVVDASVMPDLVGGNINAPVIMIAEKAADLISGRELLAPVNVEALTVKTRRSQAALRERIRVGIDQKSRFALRSRSRC